MNQPVVRLTIMDSHEHGYKCIMPLKKWIVDGKKLLKWELVIIDKHEYEYLSLIENKLLLFWISHILITVCTLETCFYFTQVIMGLLKFWPKVHSPKEVRETNYILCEINGLSCNSDKNIGCQKIWIFYFKIWEFHHFSK